MSSLLCKFCLHLNEQWSGQPKEKKKHSQIINISFSSCIILESKLKFHLKIICLSTTCSLVRRTTCFQPGQLSNLYWLLRENNGMPEGQHCCTHCRCTHKMGCGPAAHWLGRIIHVCFFLSNQEPAVLNWCPQGFLTFSPTFLHWFFFPATVTFTCLL